MVVAEAAVGRLPVSGVSRVTLSQVDISAVVAPTDTVVAHVFARADHGPRQGYDLLALSHHRGQDFTQPMEYHVSATVHRRPTGPVGRRCHRRLTGRTRPRRLAARHCPSDKLVGLEIAMQECHGYTSHRLQRALSAFRVGSRGDEDSRFRDSRGVGTTP